MLCKYYRWHPEFDHLNHFELAYTKYLPNFETSNEFTGFCAG